MATGAPPTADTALVPRSDRGGVATLTLNRPDRYNALSSAMPIELQTVPVAIAAAKKAFCEQFDAGLARACALATGTMTCSMMTAEGIDAIHAETRAAAAGQVGSRCR